MMINQQEQSPLLLLIDDSLAELRLLIELLTANRFRIAVALSGMDGYQKALLNKPDLILLDVNMPGLDGFGVCRLLQANPATKDIPVIFLTARNDPEQRVDGLLLGAVDYIPKPFSTDREVLARVRLQLRNRNSRTDDSEKGRTSDESAELSVTSVMVKAAVGYLTQNLANAPSLEELARLVGTNKTTLNMAFRKELGNTVAAYLKEQRWSHARHLLITTTIPIKMIGEHVGFGHAGNFATAFGQRFGRTPGEFRQQFGAMAGSSGSDADDNSPVTASE